MIFDRRQLAYRLFERIHQNADVYNIEILLVKSARLNINLDSLKYNGQPLIHLCCLYNRLDLLKFFVEFGRCDLLTRNRDGWLPLHIAIYLGHMDIVMYLLENLNDMSVKVHPGDGWEIRTKQKLSSFPSYAHLYITYH